VQKPAGILLDVDKTITRSDGTVSLRTIEAIKNVAEAGIKIGLSTGRNYAFLYKEILKFFPPDSLHVVAGGGQIIRTDGQVIMEKAICYQPLKAIYDLANNTDTAIITSHKKIVYTNSPKALENLKQHVWVEKATLLKPQDLKLDFYLLAITPLRPPMEELLHDLQNHNTLRFKDMYDYRNTYYADATAKGVTKAAGAKVWARLMNLNLNEIAAVGDGSNDIEVVSLVGQGIAMGNAVIELKNVANLTIEHTDDNGLAKWLEKFL
jgi:Cof subfamily protein (haloacid dehalogenase superfamily)